MSITFFQKWKKHEVGKDYNYGLDHMCNKTYNNIFIKMLFDKNNIV